MQRQTNESMGVHVISRARQQRDAAMARDVLADEDANYSATHAAAAAGKTKMLLALLSTHKAMGDVDADGRAPLEWREARFGRTVVHAAALHGHCALVHALLDAAADERAAEAGVLFDERPSPALLWRDDKGNTPLHCACASGNVELVTAMLDRCEALRDDCDRPALQWRNSTHANAVGRRGWAPLHVAIDSGHLDVALALVDAAEAASCVDERGRHALLWRSVDGSTALHVAATASATPRVRCSMLIALTKVSVLLFTVTFYANLAHSLTRSPSHL
jgi:ankyrin repeat protein